MNTYIFNHSDATAIFVGDETIYHRIKPAIDNTTAIKQIFCLEKTSCTNIISIYNLINTVRNKKDLYKEKLEQIKKFKLVADTWSSQTGELSFILKLRRKVLIDKYKHLMYELY